MFQARELFRGFICAAVALAALGFVGAVRADDDDQPGEHGHRQRGAERDRTALRGERRVHDDGPRERRSSAENRERERRGEHASRAEENEEREEHAERHEKAEKHEHADREEHGERGERGERAEHRAGRGRGRANAKHRDADRVERRRHEDRQDFGRPPIGPRGPFPPGHVGPPAGPRRGPGQFGGPLQEINRKLDRLLHEIEELREEIHRK